jgi:predicted nucleic acid-binding protein
MSFEPGKTEKSIEIISHTSAVLSTQVINELCVNLIKKAGYSESEIQQTIKNIYSHYQVMSIDEKLIIDASKTCEAVISETRFLLNKRSSNPNVSMQIILSPISNNFGE